MSDGSDKQIYYSDYLKLDELLQCQELESARRGKVAHDEMLFIVIHQAYELWFKQIIWELSAVHRLFDSSTVSEPSVGEAVHHLERITEIQKVLVQQIDVLETMTPLDFLDFRDALIPASGFQSVQFRLVENMLGLRPQDRLTYGSGSYLSRLQEKHRKLLHESESRPSLFDLVDEWLSRTPFLDFGEFNFWSAYRQAVDKMLTQDKDSIESNPLLSDENKEVQLKALRGTRTEFDSLFDRELYDRLVADGKRRLSYNAFTAALLINLYRNQPILHLPFRMLTLLMDIDELFARWRHRHALMVSRMIGSKIGTGGSSGHNYLSKVAEHNRVFTDLFNLSTLYIPRSELPELPKAVVEKMGFSLG
ncbi:MAG: tryptophan 2,3-dioxygenase [Rhodothermales bacterium]|nr:tryptophan 2,3-dioxygenase [Rhodothermales bacterium]